MMKILLWSQSITDQLIECLFGAGMGAQTPGNGGGMVCGPCENVTQPLHPSTPCPSSMAGHAHTYTTPTPANLTFAPTPDWALTEHPDFKVRLCCGYYMYFYFYIYLYIYLLLPSLYWCK